MELVTVDDNPFDTPGDGETEREEIPVVNGRYSAVHPETGKPGKFTRATTMAKTIAETYHLDRWRDRVVAKGMAMRPDLCELAQGMDVTEDRDALQEVAETAKEAAGARVGANRGTALHKHCERLEAGEDILSERLSPATRRDLVAYRDALERSGIQMLTEYTERLVFNPDSNTIGRVDRIGWDHDLWDRPRIVDLKTQKDMVFGRMEIAAQLAQYARARWMWDSEQGTWVPMPELDTDTAIVIHLPVGKAAPEFHQIDIATGWEYVKLALDTRKARNSARGVLTPVPDDREYRVRFRKATTREEFSATYRDALRAGKWTKDLERWSVDIFRQLNES